LSLISSGALVRVVGVIEIVADLAVVLLARSAVTLWPTAAEEETEETHSDEP
jgi:hypothetical protein